MNRHERRRAAKIERAARRLQTARAMVEAGASAGADTEQSDHQRLYAEWLVCDFYSRIIREGIHVPERSALAVISLDDDDREVFMAARGLAEAHGKQVPAFAVPDSELGACCEIIPIDEMVKRMVGDPFWVDEAARMVASAPKDALPIVYSGQACGSGVIIADHPSTVDPAEFAEAS